MAQRIFQSFRRLPGHLASLRKKPETVEVQGVTCKINVCCNYGFPAKPTSIAYDHILDLIGILTRDGSLQVYGRPGVLFTATHTATAEYIQVSFICGTHRLVTLTGSDDIFLWELTQTSSSSPIRLVEICNLKSVTSHLAPVVANGGGDHLPEQGNPTDVQAHVTALCCSADGASILIGTDNGWVTSVSVNAAPAKAGKEHAGLSPPSIDNAITPTRVLSNVHTNPHQRLNLDAVVVVSERPGYRGQLLIGYSSGLCAIFDRCADRTLALLPWKHELESATWCGGSGFPSRTSIVTDVEFASSLGNRLLVAYADGSLGVWSLKTVGVYSPTVVAVPNAGEAVTLVMEEPPSMPYGPFPCKSINKVFWVTSPLGGITAFSGGMPRARYGERHTVSLLRGSNLDRAAADNLMAARIAAAGRSDFDEDDDDDDDDLINADARIPPVPMHVFDSDAPEHVCLDLTSSVVDLLPIGRTTGPGQLLLILCEEELVAVDLFSPGWPFMRPPYLACLHTAAITTYSLLTQVNQEFLLHLETAGARIGPEGQVGRGSQVARIANSAGWSHRGWPVSGGQAMVSGSRLSACSQNCDNSCPLLFTDDLLLTGHEDGSVAFWRLGAGGCLRRIYTLHSAVLFEGDFDTPSHADDDSWPPFRQAGVFDPFMDDCRAAVQLIRLVDNVLVVGGAAGQISVWQLLDFVPSLSSVNVIIKSELPGFQWKGHVPLKLRNDFQFTANGPQVITSSPISRQHHTVTAATAIQLQPVSVILVQPPARITALALAEVLSDASCLLAFGSPHGYGVVHITPPSANSTPSWVLLAECTLPENVEALQEAAAGEGWARRRTRELKKSLRDSFRRLKRMRSTSRPPTGHPTHADSGSRLESRPRVGCGTTIVVAPMASSLHRAGLQRTVTQTYQPASRQTNCGPLEDAERRAVEHAGGIPADHLTAVAMASGVEREICPRTTDTANVAIVSCLTFGPPLFRSSASHAGSTIGSLFVSTKAGVVIAYSILTRQPSTMVFSGKEVGAYRLQKVKHLTLQHRAPVLSVRLMNHQSDQVFPFRGLVATSASLPRGISSSSICPTLLVVSEEQVRLFTLPALRIRHKARITAKDGFRIKAGSLIAFRQSSGPKAGQRQQPTVGDNDLSGHLHLSGTSVTSTPAASTCSDNVNYEYVFVFTNIGGQAVLLHLPQLTRKDTLNLINSNDVLAVNSVAFSEPATISNTTVTSHVAAPSLGLYQLAPGQLTMFDMVRVGQRASPLGASYRPIYRILPTNSPAHVATENCVPVNSTTRGTSRPPVHPASIVCTDGQRQQHFTMSSCNTNTTSGCYSSGHRTSGGSYASSQVNSSMFSGTTLSDSVHDYSGSSMSPSFGVSR